MYILGLASENWGKKSLKTWLPAQNRPQNRCKVTIRNVSCLWLPWEHIHQRVHRMAPSGHAMSIQRGGTNDTNRSTTTRPQALVPHEGRELQHASLSLERGLLHNCHVPLLKRTKRKCRCTSQRTADHHWSHETTF